MTAQIAGKPVGVIIGVDPHKGSHTAVALDASERKLGQLRVRAPRLRRWSSCGGGPRHGASAGGRSREPAGWGICWRSS